MRIEDDKIIFEELDYCPCNFFTDENGNEITGYAFILFEDFYLVVDMEDAVSITEFTEMEILLKIKCTEEEIKGVFNLLEKQRDKYVLKGKNQAKTEFKNWLDTREE